MAKWVVMAKRADFNGLAQRYQITPMLARIIRNRDLISDEEIDKYLNGTTDDLYSPFLMKDMEKAVEIIRAKIRQKKPVRIIGDYDVDGICASFILHKGIRMLGGNADVAIPHRIRDGYGLNERLVEEAVSDGIDTILTCDNGIAAYDQIKTAKENGMTVVVTDHHEIPFEEKDGVREYILPPADVVVDPKQPECEYPFKQVCGAVIAAKLMKALFEKEGTLKESENREFQEEMLCFEALATVCDVMELRDENRILVKEGLRLMRQTSNQGLKALLMANNINDRALTAYHIGYVLGPCMNATGRLDTARRALELFECGDFREAVMIAGELKSLNDSRKQMTEQGVMQAVTQVEEMGMERDKVLVIYLPDCHESLAGIIAGRIRERYGKPAFVLTRGEEEIKGSGRSIDEYSMYEEMSSCKDLFTKYGGHKKAAGLSLRDEASVEIFRKKLNENCSLTEEDLEEKLKIDMELPLAYADISFIKEMTLLEPFGTGNRRPVFARKNISLLTGRKVGKNKNIGKYRISEAGACYEMIYYGNLDTFDAFLTERFGAAKAEMLYQKGVREGDMPVSVAYSPGIDSYGGGERVQMEMKGYC
ncbi:MAG: single-stranded-DNA-specific exonuclease RecJ [Lachnospiraceae bacterium]|nr:single-stranded-DNA-specific exonuclease RecJ [Lachnospiraceae bacterium]